MIFKWTIVFCPAQSACWVKLYKQNHEPGVMPQTQTFRSSIGLWVIRVDPGGLARAHGALWRNEVIQLGTESSAVFHEKIEILSIFKLCVSAFLMVTACPLAKQR